MKKFYLAFIVLAFITLSCHSQSDKSNQSTETPIYKSNVKPQDVYYFQFDGFEMWSLKDKYDNPMSMDLFKDADQSIVKQLVPSGEAEASINAFLIKRNGQYILFDTGIGAENGGKMFHLLDSLGVSPEEISAVCLTHFHFDHIGGMLTNGKASFPNAELYFAAAEPKAWSDDKNVQAMLEAYKGRTHTFSDNEVILNGVSTKPAPGHTPGHTIYQIGNLVIIGDLLHAAMLQLSHPEFSARYDQDKQLAVKTRTAYYKYIEDNHYIVAGMHLPNDGVMKKFPHHSEE